MPFILYKVELRAYRFIMLVFLVYIAGLSLTGCRSVSVGIDDSIVITVTGIVQDRDENTLTVGSETYAVLVSDMLDGITVGDRVTITGNPRSDGG